MKYFRTPPGQQYEITLPQPPPLGRGIRVDKGFAGYAGKTLIKK